MARELSRRQFFKITAGGMLGLYFGSRLNGFAPIAFAAPIPGGTLDSVSVSKFQTPMLIPPAMPKAGTIKMKGGKNADYYEISMRQFAQQILPAGLPATTVWGYGAVAAASKRGLLLHNAPSLTIEASANRPVRDQVDQRLDGRERQLPAAPAAGGPDAALGQPARRHCWARHAADLRIDPRALHRAGADGHPRARCRRRRRRERRLRRGLVPARRPTTSRPATPPRAPGTTSSPARPRRNSARPGGRATPPSSTRTSNRASTIWYHDHALGMTRLNVYAGPAGFYIIRGGPDGDDAVLDTPHRAGRPCCPARRPRRTTSSRPTRPTTRSRSPSRTARSTPTARCSTRTRARSSTGSSTPYIPDGGLLADLEPGVLRQHDDGQRQHLAVPDGGAAPLPLPLPERLPVALPDPGLQPDPRRGGVADRQRGRLPGGAGRTSPPTTATGC